MVNGSKTVKGKLDPKVFDFSTVMGRVRAPQPEEVSIFLAAEIYPRIEELSRLIDEAGDDDMERSIGDPNPVDALTAEYNELVEEWNASEVPFVLRPVHRLDKIAARAALVEDDIDMDTFEGEDASVCYMLAEVVTNVDWSGAQFLEFRDQIGETAFMPLLNAANRANAGNAVSAPFSPKPLPSRTSEKL